MENNEQELWMWKKIEEFEQQIEALRGMIATRDGIIDSLDVLEAKTLTEDEVSKYWYNKGHEDGRKLAVVNTLTEARILKVIEKTSFADGYLNANLIKFAEAIIKEAQEK